MTQKMSIFSIFTWTRGMVSMVSDWWVREYKERRQPDWLLVTIGIAAACLLLIVNLFLLQQTICNYADISQDICPSYQVICWRDCWLVTVDWNSKLNLKIKHHVAIYEEILKAWGSKGYLCLQPSSLPPLGIVSYDDNTVVSWCGFLELDLIWELYFLVINI